MGACGMSGAVDATQLVAADLQSSLSFYLASEITVAAGGLLSVAELTMVSLLVAALATSLGTGLKRVAETFPVHGSALKLLVLMAGEVFMTVSFLAATV